MRKISRRTYFKALDAAIAHEVCALACPLKAASGSGGDRGVCDLPACFASVVLNTFATQVPECAESVVAMLDAVVR
jgi:hypothetical protein